MNFRVGQKVVCIDDTDLQEYSNHPVKGCVYTVRAVGFGPFTNTLYIGLEECSWASIDGSGLQWIAARFRPVVERKYDLSIFTAMLLKGKVDA